ncbi:MAG TPA: ATP synthase F1 subunit delta, partial [Polyangiaceae bacterium]|nr:ATP synthase F1 subunit delta [Polyangiaceae bacterium]
MTEAAVAQRYARAIFELGIEEHQLEALTKQVTAFANTYAANAELGTLLENPSVSGEQREAVLREVADRLGVHGLALNAIRLLARRRRLLVLPAIARQLVRLADEQTGVVRATVTSAVPLSADYVSNLEQALASMTKRRVVLEQKHDPSL